MHTLFKNINLRMVCKTRLVKDRKATSYELGCTSWAPARGDRLSLGFSCPTLMSGERAPVFTLREMREGKAILSATSANGSSFGDSTYYIVL